jgi:exoribonuclease R
VALHRRLVPPAPEPLIAGFAAIRAELGLPDSFPPDVERAAGEAVAVPVDQPRADLRALPFLTIDPPGAMDLDQAMHLSRDGDAYLVRYAIADVGAFVRPGSPLDLESHRRGATLYAPDARVPLYPATLGEDAASLLPDVDRPAVVWSLRLAPDGELVETRVERATVRSVARLDYAGAQRGLDDGSGDPMLALLRDVGRLRIEREVARGALRLGVPEQEVSADASGRCSLHYRVPLPVETWNEQISLLTGIAAAALMLDGAVGLLRTLPEPPKGAVQALRHSASGLGVGWPADVPPAAFIRSLDPAVPAQAALLDVATSLLRGAGYVAFDGSVPPADARGHAGIGAPYAHVTAPLRRLADRYVNEVCLALCAGTDVPGWVRAALPVLPEEMTSADRLARELERAVVDRVEAEVLVPLVGSEFDAVVVDTDDRGATIQLAEPAVRARLDDHQARPGERVRVRLDSADPTARKVVFSRRTSPA